MIQVKVNAAAVMMMAVFASGAGGATQANPPFNGVPGYTVDQSLAPPQPALADDVISSRPLAAVADNGHTMILVEDEVIFTPKNPTDLNEFLSRYHGRIVEDSTLPLAPPGLSGARTLPSEPLSYLIRVDLSAYVPQSFQADAVKQGLKSESIRTSSDAAGKLIGLVLHEQASGADVALNLVSHADGFIYSVPKSPYLRVGDDAMQWQVFHDTTVGHGNPWDICQNASFQWHCEDANTGSNVFKAWQFVAAHGFSYRPKIAIIDGGFWVDQNGNSMLDVNGGSPLPKHPWQYNFINSTYVAYGTNQGKCLAGAPCPWHGNGAANVAVANLSYPFDAAGTGGQVADPILLYTDGTAAENARAVKTATSWGADIISISSGTDCGPYGSWWCRHFDLFGGYLSYKNAIDDATNAGVLVVAAAGNTVGSNAEDASRIFPCYYGPVLCVGALDDGKPYPRLEKDWSSNFGPAVKLWAPTNVPIISVAGSTVPGTFNKGLSTFGGTSASTPFVAGIGAMVKALNRGLTGSEIKDLLINTAWGGVLDERRDDNGDVGFGVPRVNAYNAVVQAAGGYDLAPDVHIVYPTQNPDHVSNTGNGFVTQTFSAWAYDIDDSGPDGKTPLPANRFRWSITAPSSTSNIIQPTCIAGSSNGCLQPFPGSQFDVTGTTYDFSNEQPGARTMTATATNSHGLSGSASEVEIVSFASDPPTPVIVSPQGASQTVQVGIPVQLQGYAKSTDPGDLLGWTPCNQMQWLTSLGTLSATPSSNFSQTGICQATVTFFSPGVQQIGLKAWNRLNQASTTPVSLNVIPVTPKFDFAINLTPNWLRMSEGSQGSVIVNISLLSGSAQTVSLAGAAPLPPGMTWTLSTEQLTPPGTATLTINTTAFVTPPGDYTLYVPAQGGNVTHVVTLQVHVDGIAE